MSRVRVDDYEWGGRPRLRRTPGPALSTRSKRRPTGASAAVQGDRPTLISMRLLAVLLCVLLAGCGSIGEPLYPALRIPSPVSDLAVVERGDILDIASPFRR